MSTIITRAGKGSPLTNNEMDANLTNLNTDKIEVAYIHSATSKATPVDADEIPLVDSEASNSLKKLTWANIKSGIFSAWGVLINDGTAKTVPVDADAFAYMDSAASNATKKLTWANLKATLKSYFDGIYFSLATSQPTMRNKIINGDMRIDQRNVGAAQTITAAAALAYTVDRFYAYCTGANVTGQRVAGAIANTFRYRFTGAASNSAVGFGTRLEAENTAMMAGSTATLQAKLSSSSLTSIAWTAYYANTKDTFGTLASPTRTQIATGTFTISSTEATYSTQISIPSAATTGIEIVFTGGALLGSQTLTIGDVQLESGSVATPFEYRPYGTELALCQRYYEKSYPAATVPGTSFTAGTAGEQFSLGSSTAGIGSTATFKITKRASPTVTIFDAAGTPAKISYYSSGWNNGGALITQNNDDGKLFAQVSASASAINFQWTASAEM